MKYLLISANDICYKEKYKVKVFNSLSELFIRYTNFVVFQDMNLEFVSESVDIKEFVLKYNRNPNNIIPISCIIIIYNDYIE